MSKFVNVRRYKRSIGRECLHCGRPATTSAVRVYGSSGARFRLDVRYCAVHDDELIVNGATELEASSSR